MMIGRLHTHGRLPSLGDLVTMQLKCEAIHLFDPVSELRLR
jgi:hypothetical protein